MAILSTIHNEQWPAVFAPSVGNVIGVIGIASEGPSDPILVNPDNYQEAFGKLPVNPSLLNDDTLDADVLDKIRNKFNRSLVKSIAEIFELGNSNLPVVALRVGNPTIASLTLYEPESAQDEVTEPASALIATPGSQSATSGYQELGLSVTSTDASGLDNTAGTGGADYYFKVNGTEYFISTPGDDSVYDYDAVVSAMDTTLDSAGFTVTFETDDIRVTNDVTGASSTVTVEDGDTSPGLLATLTGYTAVDTSVDGIDADTLADNTYYYVYTYKTAYGQTTASDEAEAVVSAGGDGNVALSDITVSGDTGVTGRVIYRGTATGGPYYKLYEVTDNVTTSWVDDGSVTPSVTDVPPTYNETDVPGYDRPTLVNGSPAGALTITARAAGDEANYFYAKVNDNGSGLPGDLVISYDPPSTVSSTTGTINLIDDDALNSDFYIDLQSYSLPAVVEALQGSQFAPYIFAEINYHEYEHTFSYTGAGTYAMGEDEYYSYDLYKVDSLRLRASISEEIESGSDVYVLSKVPRKVSTAGVDTIDSAIATHEMVIADSSFALDTGVYSASLPVSDYIEDGATVTLISVKDADDIAVSNGAISGTGSSAAIEFPEADYTAATAPLTITVTYEVALTEAKLSAELYDGLWNSYFVAGDAVYFGENIPYDLELTFDADLSLTKGVDYTIDSYGNTNDRDDVIALQVFDSETVSGITSGDLIFEYQYYPNNPAITSSARPLQGGDDGNTLTHKEYKELIAKGLRDISNYAPTDLIVCGARLDDTHEGYSSSTGLPEDQPVDYVSVIDFWTKKQATNIKECRAYIGTKPMVIPDNASIIDTVYNYIDDHTTANSEGTNPKALRDKYNNFLLRFPFGDILGSTSLTPGTLYNIDPAVISLIMTRTKSSSSSKLHLPLANLATRIKIMDNALISQINAAGWEFYSGVTSDNMQTVLQAVTERSGASFGTKMDSQHIADTVFMAVRVTRELFKPFQGKPATQNRLESMRQKAISRIMDYMYPEPISSFNVTVIPRSLNDKINEKTRFRLFIGVPGIMRVIVLDTYMGVD